MNLLSYAIYDSPIGYLVIAGNEEGICSIELSRAKPDIQESPLPVLLACVKQLDDYFAGTLTEFSVKLNLKGTPFQHKVWEQLAAIPFNQKASYYDVAVAINNEKAVRAVGNANNRNPIPIIIPCHRVIGKNGSLTGYAYGVDIKQWLLDHEERIATSFTQRKVS